MDKVQLMPPFMLREHKELVQVHVRYDKFCSKSQQLITPIEVPACPVKPQVLLQCIDNRHDAYGPTYVYDWKRAEFVEYDDERHRIPKSKPNKPSAPVKVEKSPLDLSASSKVELDSEVHAQSPPRDDKDKV